MVHALLTDPVLWGGLGLMLLLAVGVLPGGKNKKRYHARLDRIKQRSLVKADTTQTLSLKRLKPGEDTEFGQMLSSMHSIAKLRARLEVAGMSHVTPQKFLGTVAGIAVFVAGLVFLVWHKPVLLCLLVGLLFGLGIPHVVVSRKVRKRQRLFLKLFPEAIELMVRGLRAGLPIAESFITVSKELPPPMGDSFAHVCQQLQLGVPMEKSLADAAKKLGLTEFNFFVTTIILQRETGGNLSEILNNLADMLRQRQMMKLKIGALSSEARASAYIIGALPFLVFSILEALSPEYLAPLFNDARGNKALMMAGGSLFMGGFIMKRMTQLEI